ncbi:lysine exporter LysO family protein [Erwinia tracheiphila]|uniref:Lysine exporter LysO family protein n=1 Tax=Erwinia tracheiphila TaxID=65700 RepID=A0A0M2KAE2_9GAMM|nr:lysine exporter LysO family protein [Erwinia tracheiphila]AXF77046.1 lysine exporter LysO family protein [Erwinia tracheiphila]KKF35899.1 membrane protein [Erwinia tracheiphila]UIA84269.1 lysine exporter LysO family protein [Erwinia tracheiphila]UIA87219.1 lysine exporter LysO family protein [Erwinia tracheiphila]UIA92850.1 lysine exporter LysO family protein [Erwinia tracheiphila]
MQESFISIALIFILLLSGYYTGKSVNDRLKSVILSQISNVVLLLLLCMGIDFGSVFTNKDIGYSIIQNAIILSATITMATFFFLYKKKKVAVVKNREQSFLRPFKGCFRAFFAFSIGVGIFRFTGFQLESIHFPSSIVLYVLIFLVGLDLVGVRVKKLTHDLVMVPVLTVLATVSAAAVCSMFSHFSWRELLVVSSGFGWFSLSGPMVNRLVSPEMGAMAFMTDFFREMFSIIFLYFLGQTQPRGAIGISGAAALDSVLPFIKENCESTFISHAIVSGFILTVLVPFIISFSVTLL